MELRGAKTRIYRYVKPSRMRAEPRGDPPSECKIYTAAECDQAFLRNLVPSISDSETAVKLKNKENNDE